MAPGLGVSGWEDNPTWALLPPALAMVLGELPVSGAVAWGDGHHLRLSPASFSAILYLNGDFEGGAFYFTELDAKTETVSSSAP